MLQGQIPWGFPVPHLNLWAEAHTDLNLHNCGRTSWTWLVPQLWVTHHWIWFGFIVIKCILSSHCDFFFAFGCWRMWRWFWCSCRVWHMFITHHLESEEIILLDTSLIPPLFSLPCWLTRTLTLFCWMARQAGRQLVFDFHWNAFKHSMNLPHVGYVY